MDDDGDQEVEEAGLFLHEMGFSPELQQTYQEFFKVDEKPREARLQLEDCIFVQEGHEFLIGGQTGCCLNFHTRINRGGTFRLEM